MLVGWNSTRSSNGARPGHRRSAAAGRQPGTVSAGFSQGYSFLALEGKEEAAPFWQLLYEQTASEATTKDDSPEQVDADDAHPAPPS